ncbi:uncharacterized protein LOC110817100 [Carica papaya]|uniref:uncharacterized protein LOC110817100 n=1 Tax=Carica papaya TaxID=3649 RepID=UPI000B8CD9EF|nr:uncharacterized protein LOC110817100 [Carica papaya]
MGCIQFSGANRHVDRQSKKNKELGGAPISVDMTLLSKNLFVRVVHPGGEEESYQTAIPASQMMDRYTGMCVARPEVFKNPHDSLLQPEEKLLPGQKYLLIPLTTVQKLTRRHQETVEVNEATEDTSDARITWDVSSENLEESVYSAKDFYVSREKSSRLLTRRNGRIKKPFVPPLPKVRACHTLGWEPNLTSIQEISP